MGIKSHTHIVALLVGRSHHLAWALPPLLHRAGIAVDLVTSSKLMKKCRFLRRYDFVPQEGSMIPMLKEKLQEPYDWIIPTEDQIMTEILDSNFSKEEKLRLLPVQREENWVHLHSKIGLSRTFAAHGIATPPFIVARDLEEGIRAGKKLSFPVLVKMDASSGGAGVYECNEPGDFFKLPQTLFKKPFLVQKKINGTEVDLSALFLKGKLIHFSYSEYLKSSKRFGPSLLRNYVPFPHVEEELFNELQKVGSALGAHGFTNMTAIRTEKGHSIFEADLRPNVWVDTPRYWGEDPAPRIAKWFSSGEGLDRSSRLYRIKAPPRVVVPYFMRLSLQQLLINRYRVWKFIPRDDWKFIARLLIYKLCMGLRKRLMPSIQPDRCDGRDAENHKLKGCRLPKRN